jgi:hypothetical protein
MMKKIDDQDPIGYKSRTRPDLEEKNKLKTDLLLGKK